MKIMRARIGAREDEEGHRPGFVVVELEEPEVRDIRARKVDQLEKGVSLWLARDLVKEIAQLDAALALIRGRRHEVKR